eukprot:4089147-Amphidinium_carterae.1
MLALVTRFSPTRLCGLNWVAPSSESHKLATEALKDSNQEFRQNLRLCAQAPHTLKVEKFGAWGSPCHCHGARWGFVAYVKCPLPKYTFQNGTNKLPSGGVIVIWWGM